MKRLGKSPTLMPRKPLAGKKPRCLLIYHNNLDHLRTEGRVCIPCVKDKTLRYLGNNKVSYKKFKSSMALTNHWHKSHNLSKDELKELKELSKSYNGGDFISLAIKRGVLKD
jgi:hypothetical protein